eukprot:GHVR01155338.1.p1 GENE.GHVR01155338.1~~GHVR01155338.1.p1  ORF type:complete len:108 (+),score=38.00 GHVR01155338.1:220-543(+)
MNKLLFFVLHKTIATIAQTVEATGGGGSLTQARTIMNAASLVGSSEGVLEGCKAVVRLVAKLHEAIVVAIATSDSAASHVSKTIEGLRELDAYDDNFTASEAALVEA